MKCSSSSQLILAVCGLILSSLAEAQPSARLPRSPTFISLVAFEGGESFSNRFGHIDLRFSYGPSPEPHDPTVGFGPRLEKNVQYAPLAFVGIGDKVPMLSWNESFQSRYSRAAREDHLRVTTLVLDLSEHEKSEVVDALNALLVARELKPYNALLRNCSSVVARILRDTSGLRGGALGFLPAQLEKKLRPFALKRQVLPSGRDLKSKVLKKHARVLERLLPDTVEREVFEAQLLSVRPESRLVAYHRLQSRAGARLLLEDLLGTESDRRRALIESKLSDPNFESLSRVLSLKKGQTLRRLKIEGSRLVLETESSAPQFAAGSRQSTTAPRRHLSSWELDSLGLENKPDVKWFLDSMTTGKGPEKRIHFWLTPDLQLDP